MLQTLKLKSKKSENEEKQSLVGSTSGQQPGWQTGRPPGQQEVGKPGQLVLVGSPWVSKVLT